MANYRAAVKDIRPEAPELPLDTLFGQYVKANHFTPITYESPPHHQNDARLGNASVAMRASRLGLSNVVSHQNQPGACSFLETIDESGEVSRVTRSGDNEPGSAGSLTDANVSVKYSKKQPKRPLSENVNYALYEQFKLDNPDMFNDELSTRDTHRRKPRHTKPPSKSFHDRSLDQKFRKAKNDLHMFKVQEVCKVSDYEQMYDDDILHDFCNDEINLTDSLSLELVSENMSILINSHEALKTYLTQEITEEEKPIVNASKYNTLIPTVELCLDNDSLIDEPAFRETVMMSENVPEQDKKFVSNVQEILSDCRNVRESTCGIYSDDSNGVLAVFYNFLRCNFFSNHEFTLHSRTVPLEEFINLYNPYHPHNNESIYYDAILENGIRISEKTGAPSDLVISCLVYLIFYDKIATTPRIRPDSLCDLLRVFLQDQLISESKIYSFIERMGNRLFMSVDDLLGYFSFYYLDRRRVFRLVFFLDHYVSSFFKLGDIG